jgi:hypothetical protein
VEAILSRKPEIHLFNNREDINFLFQYEFFAGSNIYFVYNYKDIQGDIENLFMAKIAYEIRF